MGAMGRRARVVPDSWGASSDDSELDPRESGCAVTRQATELALRQLFRGKRCHGQGTAELNSSRRQARREGVPSGGGRIVGAVALGTAALVFASSRALPAATDMPEPSPSSLHEFRVAQSMGVGGAGVELQSRLHRSSSLRSLSASEADLLFRPFFSGSVTYEFSEGSEKRWVLVNPYMGAAFIAEPTGQRRLLRGCFAAFPFDVARTDEAKVGAPARTAAADLNAAMTAMREIRNTKGLFGSSGELSEQCSDESAYLSLFNMYSALSAVDHALNQRALETFVQDLTSLSEGRGPAGATTSELDPASLALVEQAREVLPLFSPNVASCGDDGHCMIVLPFAPAPENALLIGFTRDTGAIRKVRAFKIELRDDA